jgi:AcrR family transcriptional regulator
MVRKRLELDERRTQLIELGLELFSDRSYDEVSIDQIAAAAKISKGLLYHYFPTKRAFYVATVRFGAEALLDATAPDMTLPENERAYAGLSRYLAYVEAHAGAYQALLRSGIGMDDEVAAIVERTRSTIIDRMQASIGLAAPRPVFRTMFRAFIGSVEAASLDWLDRHDVEREQLLQMLLVLLYWSIRTAMTFDPEAGVTLEVAPPF